MKTNTKYFVNGGTYTIKMKDGRIREGEIVYYFYIPFMYFEDCSPDCVPEDYKSPIRIDPEYRIAFILYDRLKISEHFARYETRTDIEFLDATSAAIIKFIKERCYREFDRDLIESLEVNFDAEAFERANLGKTP